MSVQPLGAPLSSWWDRNSLDVFPVSFGLRPTDVSIGRPMVFDRFLLTLQHSCIDFIFHRSFAGETGSGR